MGLLKLQKFCLVLKVLAFSCFFVLKDASAVSGLSAPSSVVPALPPLGEEIIGDISPSQTNGMLLKPPIAPPPTMSAPGPELSRGFTPTSQPNDPASTPPNNSDHPPGALSGSIPVSSPSNNPYQNPQHPDHPIIILEASDPPIPLPDPPNVDHNTPPHVPLSPPTYQSPPASDPSIPLPDPPTDDHNNTPPHVPLSPAYQSPPRSPASHPPIPLPDPPSVDHNNIPPHVPLSPTYQSPPSPPASDPPIPLPDPPTDYHNNTPPHVPLSPPTYQSPPASHPPIPLPEPPNVDHNNTPKHGPLSPAYQSQPRPPASHPPIPLPDLPSVDHNNTPPYVQLSPAYQSPPRRPTSHPPISLPEPPSVDHNNTPPHIPLSPAVNEPPPRIIRRPSPPVYPVEPVAVPPSLPEPVAPTPSKSQDTFSPPRQTFHTKPPSNLSGEHNSPPVPSRNPVPNSGRAGKPVAAPTNGTDSHHMPMNPSSPTHAPDRGMNPGSAAKPVAVPLPGVSNPHPAISPLPSNEPEHPRTNTELHASPPWKSEGVDSPGPSSVSISPSHRTKVPIKSPEVTHSHSISKFPKMPVQALPPPPPNEDCASLTCSEPFTNGPSGSPCRCILPIQVGLRLGVALYTFFPLVSELAAEISAGDFLDQSQVRIMGANEASQDPEKTIVLTDLVPLGEKFDNITANLIFQRFWHKQVDIKTSLFGNYEVLYVRYPGLPPSPPSATSDIDVIDNDPYHNHNNSSRTTKPIGVDVSRIRHSTGPNKGVIAIIVLSASLAIIVFCSLLWVFLFKDRGSLCHPQKNPPAPVSSLAKSSGPPASVAGSGPGSASMSLGSSIAAYNGSMKTFSSSEIERATDYFNETTVLGEGGFGRVYRGVLDDGTKVAVKVLKRDDHQGGREFLAEVEMLSRLHHRNLVKLIGICIEERSRCLVYELVPNGSVESSLHGVDEGTAPLDWTARLKIALGAARGLAYLHEDSSPRVIHRDFKASNILLEDDYTPKVSDFGLARAALDENNSHISTRVMGTFGYVAPEYAMTGHLLVKSDVYSYGVVLLELLTGKKPVDMSQPPGQENLVSWARPLLTSKEGLESIIDPSLGPNFPLDSIAKVAAIASMCVQPEVSNRPFMGEVVQALKLVCNECEETRELGSRSCSREDISIDMDARTSSNYSECEPNPHCSGSYDFRHDVERGLSVSGLMSSSGKSERMEHEELRRHSSSGPLRSTNTRWPWQNLRRLSGGSISEHRMMYKLWPRNR
ncbi:hypothetical protein LIER_03768 [Lithospermum erythrorhizon]|uniref:Protein kinase domain-containing protein n=1 Tax=Lithospermum erythrorhizon TaxID=34254 RepID=A0AAV3NVI1_LITER